MDTKVCSSCKLELPLTFFSTNSKGKFGRAQKCKACSAEVARKYRDENEYKYKAAKYNTTEDVIEYVLSKTHCEICGVPATDTKMVIDHCHTTGKVRGLLCDSCNIAIGRFYENTASMLSAINYLEKHKNEL